MRRTFVLSVFAATWCLGSSAAAQTPVAPAAQPQAASSPAKGTGFYISGNAGIASVEHVGGMAGGEAGFRLSDRLEIFGEGVWMEDVVTRRRLEHANTVAAYLQASQGKPATGTVIAPASYGGGGVRFMFMTSGSVRPYATLSVGGAHIALQPVFTLNGTDVTSSIGQYGVTLGSDLTGEVNKPAFGGGGGVRFALTRWYMDGGVRVISIRTSDQTTNVLGVSATAGIKF